MKKIKLHIVILIVLVFLTSNLSVKANGEIIIKRFTGIIFGDIFGPLIAADRGFCSGFLKGTNVTASALGNENGKTERFFGYLSGGLVYGVTGSLTGYMKGHRDAFKYGISDPLTKENFSLAGNNYFDYDPFNWD